MALPIVAVHTCNADCWLTDWMYCTIYNKKYNDPSVDLLYFRAQSSDSQKNTRNVNYEYIG